MAPDKPMVEQRIEFVIVGWRSSDPAQYVTACSNALVEATLNGSVMRDEPEYTLSGGIVVASSPKAQFEFHAKTDPDMDEQFVMTVGTSYSEALTHLVNQFPYLRSRITHHRIAEAVADALEVHEDDDLVQRIAAAIMDTGVVTT